MKSFCVKLIRMKLGMLKVEPVDEEIRLFSTLEKMRTWLVENGFVYGQRTFFDYPTGDQEWFHKDDIRMEYVDVIITEIDVDDFSKSKFKNLAKMHREWLTGFFEE